MPCDYAAQPQADPNGDTAGKACRVLADELLILLEGVRVTAQSGGTQGLAPKLLRMGGAMIAAHAAAR
jgi:hypothetical protein